VSKFQRRQRKARRGEGGGEQWKPGNQRWAQLTFAYCYELATDHVI
jgi:hypothetical protein